MSNFTPTVTISLDEYNKLIDIKNKHLEVQVKASVNEYSEQTLLIHSIRIKNKSELKRLMEQLNIIQ